MTPDEAATLHGRMTAFDAHVMWFVTVSDPMHPDQAVAWAMIADPQGCERLPGELTASTVSEVRAMLPRGLVRRDRTPFMPDGVVERWE